MHAGAVLFHSLKVSLSRPPLISYYLLLAGVYLPTPAWLDGIWPSIVVVSHISCRPVITSSRRIIYVSNFVSVLMYILESHCLTVTFNRQLFL